MSGWDDYRRRRAALELAAELASSGRADEIEERLAASGYEECFTGRHDLAVFAGRRFWAALIAAVDDAYDAAPGPVGVEVIEVCWQRCAAATPGVLALADIQDGDERIADSARLLALYSGAVGVDAPGDEAAAAGFALARACAQPIPAGGEAGRYRARRAPIAGMSQTVAAPQAPSGSPRCALYRIALAASRRCA